MACWHIGPCGPFCNSQPDPIIQPNVFIYYLPQTSPKSPEERIAEALERIAAAMDRLPLPLPGA